MWIPRLWILLVTLLATAACRPAMADQPRYEVYEASTDFADGASARPLIDGTVPRDAIVNHEELRTGRDPETGQFVTSIPVEVTDALLAQGEERYRIYCTPCHGDTGEGDGLVVQHGFPAPPNLHDEAMQQLPAGFIFDVITHGYGQMFSYADRTTIEERWAIVAYLRQLQDNA